MEIDMLETTKGTIIKVVGVGGAGGNAVQGGSAVDCHVKAPVVVVGKSKGLAKRTNASVRSAPRPM